MSCRIVHTEVNGWHGVQLVNEAIAVTVLPDKGADIYAFVDRASGIDVLMKTPWGLLPPGAPPRSANDRFSQNYEGAWQELLPNTGPPCTHLGRQLSLHGEVATLPWTSRIDRDDADCVQISLEVRCEFPSLALTRRMSISVSSPVLRIEEDLRNLSDHRVQFVWGHHPVLGAPFLEAGCQMRVADCTVHTPAIPFDPPNTSYAPGQQARWPSIRALDGRAVDLRVIPGPDARIHDHACLTDLARGWVEVENARLRLRFTLEWDPQVFRWINNWRPFGSASAPLEGIYGLAIEPWVAWGNLEQAAAAGTALTLDAGATLSTWLKAELRNLAH